MESRSGPRKDTLLEWDWPHGKVTEIDPVQIRAALSSKAQQRFAHQDDSDDWKS